MSDQTPDIASLKVRIFDLEQAKAKAVKDADAWHVAYDTLCSDLAYEMGMDSPSVAGDYQVKARVKELVADARRFLDNGARALTEESWARATAEKERDEARAADTKWDRLKSEIPRIYGREHVADLPHDSEYATALHDVLVAMKRIENNSPLLSDADTTPVYESPEELTAEITKLRRENAALQQLATRAEKDVATLTADRDQVARERDSRLTLSESSNLARKYDDAIARVADLEEQQKADDEVKASLRRRMLSAISDRDRALEESARSYSQGVEDMREEAARWLEDHGNGFEALAIRDVALSPRTSETGNAPAPRDTELTQQVRALVKRYGGPNVAYVAAQQAGRH